MKCLNIGLSGFQAMNQQIEGEFEVTKDALEVSINYEDDGATVAEKTRKALEQFKNPIEGEYAIVTEKKALAERTGDLLI